MEAYPNPRWRDSNNHQSNRLPNYSSYHHQPQAASSNQDFPHPPPLDHRQWQRNGPLGPGSWARGTNSWPSMPPVNYPPPPPLVGSNNVYMRMPRKERVDFTRDEPNRMDSPDRLRREFPFHSSGFTRRPDGFQHGYNGPMRSSRYSHNRTGPPRDYVMPPHNYDQFSDNHSPLSQSPVYSEPTSSPGSRTWDSPSLSDRGPSLKAEDPSLRDPRCTRLRHSSSDEFHRKRNSYHPYDVSSNTSPNRDPRRLHSRSFFEKNKLANHKIDRNGLSSLHTTTAANSLSNSNLSESESNHTLINETTQSHDQKYIKSLEVLKSVLNRIMIEHSYTQTKFDIPHSLAGLAHLSSTIIEHIANSSSLSTESNVSQVTLSEEEEMSDTTIQIIDEISDLESSIDVMNDQRSNSDDSFVSTMSFDIDLDTDSDAITHSSVNTSPLIISIPLLILSQFCQDVNKPMTTENNRSQSSTRVLECSPVGEKTRITRRSKRLQRSDSKDEDSCSTASSTSRTSSTKKMFQDFIPEIIETRSRAEAATVRRREKMKKEIERNEREREATAISNEDQFQRLSPSLQDDSSSTVSFSSYQDTIIRDEFTPEFIDHCKRCYSYSRSIGSGDSILHKVCRKGKLKVARYFILMEKHKVDVQDNAGWTPLHEACNNGFTDIASVLLSNGADPNLPAFDGSRPIHDAIEAGSLPIVKLLVEYGADYLAEQGEKTPLELARTLNTMEIVEYLEDVINDRKNRKQMKTKEKILMSPVTEKKRLLSSSEAILHCPIIVPFDGYKEPLLGPELDSPVIYISSIIEESQVPFLPLYNIQVSHGINPRKHNFHLLSDVLQSLSISRKALMAQLDVNTYSLTVGNFLQQLLSNPLSRHSSIIEKLHDVDIASQIELVPLCNSLRRLLGIQVANIDDY